MKSSSGFALAAAGILGLSSAIPTQLQKRTGESPGDPFYVTVDCTGTEAVCNADCFAILCLDAPNPTQWDAKKGDDKRRLSGYSSTDLKADYEKRLSWGIDISDEVLDKTGRSMEETVMANAVQGGEGEIIVPVQPDQNMQLGARVIGQMKHEGVQDQLWYYRVFNNFGSGAPYCVALQADYAPDVEICTREDKSADDPAKIAFTRVEPVPEEGHAQFHMIDPENIGDRWTGRYWQAGPSKKVKREVEDVKQKAEKSEA
ncbi:hypothetical protein BDV96DRAFT_677393 [Lophiotrema nucula]|uniref:Uncharacterized protein n=1 Tax=Lophiotrema nucula TaxID=690887 RepID=A0A6A5YH97_9PLEO|nr:hypothetical protein BDV96DRAFT_677393 [Lophiotrema nucula]